MPNLNEATVSPSNAEAGSPRSRTWLHEQLCPAFYMGATLLLLSVNGIVPARLGWLGFGIAVPAAILSHRLKRPAIVEPRGYAILNVHLLRSKGGAYRNAIERFQNGDVLIYDGVEFDCRSNNKIVCRVVADRTSLDDNAAVEIASHAQSVLESLRNNSTEFDSSVNERNATVVIMSGQGANAFELCAITDDNLDWRMDGSVNHPMHWSGDVGPRHIENQPSPPRDR